MENSVLFLDSRGYSALTMLANSRFAAAMQFSHLISDNREVTDMADEMGNLNGHTGELSEESVAAVAEHYEDSGRKFNFVILTETDRHLGDRELISELNYLVEAARPVLENVGTVVICITERKLDPDELGSPEDSVTLVKTVVDAITLFLKKAR